MEDPQDECVSYLMECRIRARLREGFGEEGGSKVVKHA